MYVKQIISYCVYIIKVCLCLIFIRMDSAWSSVLCLVAPPLYVLSQHTNLLCEKSKHLVTLQDTEILLCITCVCYISDNYWHLCYTKLQVKGLELFDIQWTAARQGLLYTYT